MIESLQAIFTEYQNLPTIAIYASAAVPVARILWMLVCEVSE